MDRIEGDAVGWPWPPELDGPIAAPDQHRVIFENDRVRVLETTIRAGEPPFAMPRAMWSDFTPAHTLENTGDDDLIVIGVELKD